MSTAGSESKWELATLRALARDAAQQLQLTASAAGGAAKAAAGKPMSRRAARDADGKAAKVMHLLLWGPK
ncbi:hypothetical protein QOZ80_2AG0102270 [Eleusine coracana subsp. coracana]|nr:hypothetical protein QOZ80_2AG0102270 [Eleusine coracana subsp. coracana]